MPPAPNESDDQVLAWTGSEVLAAGSDVHGKTWGIGGEAYDPTSRSWHLLPFDPDERASTEHVEGVWTGHELVVVMSNAEPQFFPRPQPPMALELKPGDKRWTPLPALPVPVDSEYPFSVGWTGKAIVVAGMDRPTFLLTSGATRWRALSLSIAIDAAPIPAGHDLLARAGEVTPAVELVGRQDRWEPVPPAPMAVTNPGWGDVWTGQRYLVVQRACPAPAFAESLDPGPERWTERAIDSAPLQCGLLYETAWDGAEIIMLQTETKTSAPLTRLVGAALNPVTGHWRRLTGPQVSPLDGATLLVGSELLVFGRAPATSPTVAVAAYRPPSPLPTLTSPPAPVSPTALPGCKPGELSAALVDRSYVSHESVSETIGLTNTGPAACTVQGTPSLALFDQERRQVPSTDSTGGPSPVVGPAPSGPVVVEPGALNSVIFDVEYQTSDGDYGSCPTNAPTSAEVTTKDLGAAVPVAASPGHPISQLAACGDSYELGPIAPAESFG